MKYWVEEETLILEGEFEAVSTGLLGGWKKVEHIFNHTVRDDFDYQNPVQYLKKIAKKYALKNYFGLLTAVPMENLCIVNVEDVTVFATAGVTNPNEKIGTINIIIVVNADISRGGMLNAIITATEAKTASLFEMGFKFTGTNTDAVVVAKTGGKYYEYSGPASELGKKIWKGVKQAVKQGIIKTHMKS